MWLGWVGGLRKKKRGDRASSLSGAALKSIEPIGVKPGGESI